MAFCGYCGAQMPDDMSFCTECGKPLTRGKSGVIAPANDPDDVIGVANDILTEENSYSEQNDAPGTDNSA